MNANEYGLHTRVVLVGVSRYVDDGYPALPSASRDATRLAVALANELGCGIPRDQITLLVDDRARSDAVLASIATAVRTTGPTEQLLISFSGHGIQTSQGFALCCYEASPGNPERGFITSAMLDDVLMPARARGVLIILDCCNGAALAEGAPAFFKTLAGSDFRILLSSARADRPSLELPNGEGTLFTHSLLRAVSGDLVVDPGGFIYFSRLLSCIQFEMDEGFETRYPGLEPQECVFVGVYARDPLIFLHRRFTLEQVRVHTSRYSPAYVRRLVSRLIAYLLMLIGFAIGTHYSVLEHTSYAVLRANVLTIFDGIPGFNAYGFPRERWSLNLDAGRLEDGSPLAGSKAVVAPTPEILTVVRAELNAVGKAEFDNDFGNPRRAHIEAKQYLETAHKNAPEEDVQAATRLLVEAPLVDDLAVLEALAESPYSDVRLPAINGLFRIGCRRAPELAVKERPVDLSGPARLGASWERDILGIQGVKDPSLLSRYFDYLGHSSYLREMLEPIVDCALINNVRIRPETILKLLKCDSDPSSIAPYIRVVGVLKELKRIDPSSEHYLHPAVPELDAARQRMLNGKDEFEREAGAEDMCRLYPQDVQKSLKTADVRRRLLSDVRVTAVLTRYRMLSPERVLNLLTRYYRNLEIGSRLVKSLGRSSNRAAAARLERMVRDRSLYVAMRRNAFEALVELQPNNPLVHELCDQGNSEELRRAAFAARLAENSDEAVDALLSNVEKGDIVGDMLRGLPLRNVHLLRLRSCLQNRSESRLLATSILAMKGEPHEVVSFLTSRDVGTREMAARYAAYHSRFEWIVAETARVLPYPDPIRNALQRELTKRRLFEQQVKAVPKWAKRWRVGLLLRYRDPSEGLAIWLDELGRT